MTTTQGVSPKTLAAGVAPTAGGVVVALVNLAITGTFDTTSIAALIAGSAGGLTSTIAAYLAKPGIVHEIAVDGEAVAKAVAKADPGLLTKFETLVKSEEAKVPTALQPILHAMEAVAKDLETALPGGAIEKDELDPMLAGVTADENVPPPVGDAGQPSAPAPDPRDAEIAALQAQLADAQSKVILNVPTIPPAV
jgi:uncharacterized membrane protein (UPF0136 family)